MLLVRVPEAAKILDVSKATLDTWRSRGGGPVYVKYGRAVRYRTEDLDKFVAERICENTSKGLKKQQRDGWLY